MEGIKLASLALLALSSVFWLVALGGLAGLDAGVCGAPARGLRGPNGALARAQCAQLFGLFWCDRLCSARVRAHAGRVWGSRLHVVRFGLIWRAARPPRPAIALGCPQQGHFN